MIGWTFLSVTSTRNTFKVLIGAPFIAVRQCDAVWPVSRTRMSQLQDSESDDFACLLVVEMKVDIGLYFIERALHGSADDLAEIPFVNPRRFPSNRSEGMILLDFMLTVGNSCLFILGHR